jgi:leucyl/phenylalanyl-tRNA--protein transferase
VIREAFLRQFTAQLGLEPCRWTFPDHEAADVNGLVATGADLAPATLITAYVNGFFPMPLGRRRTLGWWSPNPRGILNPEDLRVTRSLRQALKRFEIRIDTSFEEVMTRCGDPRRPSGWITRDFIDAYTRLHELGLAHSVESWNEGRLVGGLYGVSIGGFFAGESMFFAERDASKVALVALVEILSDQPDRLLDTQWTTPHLISLGATDVDRSTYLTRLTQAIVQRPISFQSGTFEVEASR